MVNSSMDVPVEKVAKPVVNQSVPAPAPEPVPTTPETAPTTSPPAPESENKTSPTNDAIIPSDPYYMDPLFYEMANYFGIQQEEYATAKYKLSDILEYIVKEKKSNKPEDVLLGLRELEDKIQPPSWDEKRYTNMHKYIRLAAKKQSFEQALKAFEKGAFNG